MKKILLLLADGFEILEAGVFIDVIGWNLVDGDKSTQLHSCGLRKEIKSAFSQKFIVDFTVDEIRVDEYAALAIPGGFKEYDFYKDAYSEKFCDLIAQFNNRNKPIFSICTGALPIAKSGALNGRKATTYNKDNVKQNQLKDMGVSVVSSPIVVDGNITTSWNPSTAMEVAFLLLQSVTSSENVRVIKNLMGFDDKI